MIAARSLSRLSIRLHEESRSIYSKQSWKALTNCCVKSSRPYELPFVWGMSRQRHAHSGKAAMLGTTVLCVRKGATVVIIADGQVTQGSEIIKPNVRKVRKIGENVIGGFAGATADALTLFERLENQLEEHSGQLTRAAVELAKQWRTDKFLRRLDAVMVVADAEISLTITGNGEVLEPHDGVAAIGSGGPYAIAAARALVDQPMDAEAIARKAMKIAADCCIYTNHNFTIERIDSAPSVTSSPNCEPVSKSTSGGPGDSSRVGSDAQQDSSMDNDFLVEKKATDDATFKHVARLP